MPLRVRKVYPIYKTVAMGGCDGRSAGHDGSLAPIWIFRVLQCLGFVGQRLVDLGAGNGRVLASALACGAEAVFGHELPENKACKFVMDDVLKTMDASHATSGSPDPSFYSGRALWLPDDINQVVQFSRQVRMFS